MEKAQKDVKDSYLAMVWLCDELKCAAEKGHVIKLNDAWDRYCAPAEKGAIEIPARILVGELRLSRSLCIRLVT